MLFVVRLFVIPQANLDATSNKTYDDAINAAEANYLDDLYAQQTLMFATFDTTINTDYTQYLKDDASNKETWWSTSGRNLFTAYQDDLASINQTEQNNLNQLAKDADAAFANGDFTRQLKQIAAENTRYLADLVAQRETEIAQAEHDASYQQQIAAANETNSVTPDETVLVVAKETAAYDYQTNIVTNNGTSNVDYATTNLDYNTAIYGTVDAGGTVNYAGSVAEQDIADINRQQNLELAQNAEQNLSEKSIATKTKEYIINIATSLRDSLTTFATTNSTPWSTFAKNQAIATTTKTTTLETAKETRNIVESDTYQQQSNTESLAWRDQSLTEIASETKRIQTITTAELDNETSTQNFSNTLTSSGAASFSNQPSSPTGSNTTNGAVLSANPSLPNTFENETTNTADGVGNISASSDGSSVTTTTESIDTLTEKGKRIENEFLENGKTNEDIGQADEGVGKICFVAGTPILTPFGSKPIEEFKAGDKVLSKPEDDAEGAVRVQVVEEVFRRQGPTLKLHIGGKLIETTREHPFYVEGKGWLPAKDLEVGDMLTSANGNTIAVDEVELLEEIKPVYNMRISTDHTYFVGDDNWEFSIWVHNADGYKSFGFYWREYERYLNPFSSSYPQPVPGTWDRKIQTFQQGTIIVGGAAVAGAGGLALAGAGGVTTVGSMTMTELAGSVVVAVTPTGVYLQNNPHHVDAVFDGVVGFGESKNPTFEGKLLDGGLSAVGNYIFLPPKGKIPLPEGFDTRTTTKKQWKDFYRQARVRGQRLDFSPRDSFRTSFQSYRTMNQDWQLLPPDIVAAQLRQARIKVLKESNAYRWLKRLELENKGAHFLSGHGAGTNLVDHEIRAMYGIRTYDLRWVRPENSSRFFSNVDQMHAIDRGMKLYKITGDNRQKVTFEYAIGEGAQKYFIKANGRFHTPPWSHPIHFQSNKVQIYFKNDLPYTAFPLK